MSNLSVFTPPAYFNLFGLEVRFYGIIIGIGIFVAIFVARQLAKYRGLEKDIPYDLALVCVPFGIIGARLFHVFSRLDEYTFLEALRFWEGGLAIFGALICGGLAILVYCLIKKLNFFKVADITVPCVLLAQGIGRWGNYFNQELYGPKVDFGFFPISVWIESENAFHVGMFFIESVWNIAGFFVLFMLLKKTKKVGVVFSTYLAWYGFGRFFTELFRNDVVAVGNITFWQIFAIIAFIVGIAGIIYFCLRKTKDKENAKCLN